MSNDTNLEPYVEAKPNDIISSKKWNMLQKLVRKHIQGHDHSGGDKGKAIGTAGIAHRAIKAEKIAEGAVTEAKLDPDVRGKLVLGGVLHDHSPVSGGAVIGTDGVKTDSIEDDAVTEAKLDPDVRDKLVLRGDLHDHSPVSGGAVIGTDGVKTDSIEDDAVTEAKLAPEVRDKLIEQVTWVNATLEPGWSNYQDFAKAAYAIDSMGFVHLRGAVVVGRGPWGGAERLIFVLRGGYWPSVKERFAVLFDGGEEMLPIHLWIQADGRVVALKHPKTLYLDAELITLSGITFHTK